jgi:hypothetical protein
MKHHRKLLVVTGLIAAFCLAGCGGSDNNGSVSPTGSPVVPESSGVSTDSFVSYIRGLSSDDESSEPSTLTDSFAAPADETSEPTPLT